MRNELIGNASSCFQKFNPTSVNKNFTNSLKDLLKFKFSTMNESKVNTFFVSEKISKIRWVPEQLKESERFLTGSWDSSKNYLKIWRLMRNQYADDYNEYVPKCVDKVAFHADISGLEFINDDIVAVSTTDGHISVMQIKRAVEDDVLQKNGQTTLLHKFNSGEAAPCTAISIFGRDIASVGEDGRLNIIEAGNLNVVKSIEADSCALTSVAYVNPKEVLTANRMGIIKIFDIRSSDTESKNSFMISCEDDKKSNYISCLTFHPTQKHIILAGSEEGSITVWDLRQPGYPASYLSAHNSAITEIGFHRSEPTKLFTAAECGELWQWTQNSISMPNNIESKVKRNTTNDADNINPWLNGERAKTRINVTSLIADLRKSINTFDSHGSTIICGSDSEAIYFIDSII